MRLRFSTMPAAIGPTGAAGRISTKKASCCGWTWMPRCASLTKDKKSINDFCRIFHGGPGGEPALKTYNFEDMVETLNGLAPYDWAGFLRSRLDGVATKTPDEAVTNSGWKLVYNDQPNEVLAVEEALARRADFSFTMGMTVVRRWHGRRRDPRWPRVQSWDRTRNENCGGERGAVHFRRECALRLTPRNRLRRLFS